MFFAHRIQKYSQLLALVVLSGFCCQLFAEGSKTFGDYEVFYSVLNSTFIKPEVAQRYNIVRGEDRALVNIAVRKSLPRGMSEAVSVTIKGSSSDLIRSTPLEFREIREKDAIYYLAEVRFLDKELRSFTIDIQPAPDIAPYTLKFNQKLYED